MNKKFIRLHNADENTVMVVNIEHIVLIDTDNLAGRPVSIIYMDSTSNMEEYKVNETPEKIFSMINELSK